MIGLGAFALVSRKVANIQAICESAFFFRDISNEIYRLELSDRSGVDVCAECPRDAVEYDKFSNRHDQDFACSYSPTSQYDVPNCTRPLLTFIADSEVSEATIPEGGELFFYAYSCVGPIGTPNLIIHVRSKWGFLPKAHFPVLPIAWIETVYYIALLILWVINRVHHKSWGLVIHNLIFVAIDFALLTSVLTGALYAFADSKRGRNHLIYVSE